MLSALSQHLQNVSAHMLDMLLPPLCLSCDGPVGAHQTLCPTCWSHIHFITPPLCTCCGAPFDAAIEGDMLCGSCINEPPYYTQARAAMLYDDGSRALVLGFKHGDHIHRAGALATWMKRAGHDMLAKADYIVPVPLHRWRLFQRRYNQSALLALALGEQMQKPVHVDALQRLRATPSQGQKNRKQRQDNVKGAFGLDTRYQPLFVDKMIVLIDDVLTTGATVNECSRILLAAGAARVDVLSLARVKSIL